MNDPPRALFITRLPPCRSAFGGGGANAYSAALLEHFAQRGFRVSVLQLEPLRIHHEHPYCPAVLPGTDFEMLCPGYVRVGRSLWSGRGIIRSVWRKIVGALSSRPWKVDGESAWWGVPLKDDERTWIRAVAQATQWNLVVVNYCWLAEAFVEFPNHALTMILTHDVWHQHVLRTHGLPPLKSLSRDKEGDYLRMADVVIAITAKDAEVFRGMIPERRVVVTPMSCRPPHTASSPANGRLLFVGSSYQPNVEAIEWFRQKVGPELERRRPGHFTLTIAGSVCNALSPHAQGLREEPLGFVEDLGVVYAEAEIVVIPVQCGSGLKIKLVEALSHGKAVVTTWEGVRGVEGLAGSAVCVADESQKFADAIVALTEDPQRRAAFENAARTAAIELFSESECFRQLDSAIDELLPHRAGVNASTACA